MTPSLLALVIAIKSAVACGAFVIPQCWNTKRLLTRWQQQQRPLDSTTVMATTITTSEFVENKFMEDDDDNDYDEEEETSLISFEELGLCREALSAVRAQPDWKTPTPIQQLAIPRLLVTSSSGNKKNSEADDDEDEDDEIFDSVWCEAPTGSGKTAAYALPLLHNILQNRRRRSRQRRQPQQPQPRQQRRTNRNDQQQENDRVQPPGDIVKSLILCPTRELAIQIGSVLSNLATNMSTRRKLDRGGASTAGSVGDIGSKTWNIQVIYGGVPLEPQISTLAACINEEREIDVLVATPGRLADLMTFYSGVLNKEGVDNAESPSSTEAALERRLLDALDATGRKDASLSLSKIQALRLDRMDDDGRQQLRNLLSNVEYLVLDEADRLLGRAFENEMDSLLKLITSQEQVKTWLFSATFPKQMEPRIDHVLKTMGGPAWKPPLRISCAQSDRLQQEVISSRLRKRLDRVTANTTTLQRLEQVGPASTIQLRTIRLEKGDRTQALRRLLETEEGWDRVLVFVATRYSSEHVATKLQRVGISSAELHGKLDQDARLRRLADFRKGKIRVLLATDVASRGLDVVGLPVVVNYDLPRSTTDFTHRVGRTGRAGKRGVAITFVTPESEPHLDLIEKRHLPNPVERELLPGLEPDEEEWRIKSEATRMETPGVEHSTMGLAHDRMFGGIKGRRKSKKDRLREKIVRNTTTIQQQLSP